jgi:hypothetical protein
MNITGRPPVQKGIKPRLSRGKARQATRQERMQWEKIRALGCILDNKLECSGRITIHHCGTGAGGRKDHAKVIPLCHEHHQGHSGIDGKRMSKREWQTQYGSEEKLLKRVQRRLESPWKDENNE